jgi:uncharacterized protein YbcC (UPF0753/DUF2309 family)
MQKKFRTVDDTFDKLAAKHKSELENAKIKAIHPDFPFAQNGICAMIGSMNAGKSYNYLKMVAQQEVLFDEPFFELVVICSTSDKFDKTVQTFRQAIRKSKLEAVQDSDLMRWLEEYIAKVLLYNTLMKFVNNGLKNPDEEMTRIINENSLRTPKKTIEFISKKFAELGWRTYPHRCLLILDDFHAHPLLKRKEDPLSRMLKKLRHFNINVIIAVQTTKSIPKDLKRTLSDAILFTGISEEDFKYLIKESMLSLKSPDALWSEYSKISVPQTQYIIHTAARKIVIKYPH